MTKALLTTLLVLIAAGAQAQSSIYKTVDENGNVVFTDAPPANSGQAERVEIQPINTTPPVEKRAPVRSRFDDERFEEEVVEQVITILRPSHEEQIPMGPGNFSVSIKVSPPLENSQSLQLFMDGVPYGSPQRDSTWALTNVFRGGHEIAVGVMDDKGEIPTMSEPITVYVQRPSIR